MKIFRLSHASIAGLLAVLFGVVPLSAETPDIRGITLSTHRAGRELGDPELLRPTFEAILETGANWVAVHPYARIRKDGTVSFRQYESGPPTYWTEPIRVAHEKGLKICIKPHLAHWRSGFTWRGEIEFETEEEWRRFWDGYAAWITALAEACRDADLFVVGTELDRTTSHEEEWRKLIAEVRERSNAPITFASNWDAFEKVPFWDALDYVGIQAYFPITDSHDPTRADLKSGWKKLASRLERYSERAGRKVVLTELGYNQSWKAASEPWQYQVDKGTEILQARCTAVALEAVSGSPSIVGSFLWKWFPEPRPVGRNFQLATPLMRKTLQSVWRQPEPVTPEVIPGD